MSARKIKAREMVTDIKSGMTTRELMDKYHMSKESISEAIEKILEERANVARMMSADIKEGMSVTELMAKYQLSPTGLGLAMKVLTDEGFIQSKSETRVHEEIRPQEHADRRESPRRLIPVTVPVLDSLNLGNKGTVRDLTEKGLSVIGVEASVGQIKRLAVMGDDLGALDPFEVQAECRWVQSGTDAEHPVAGFQITEISDRDMECLRNFLRMVKFEE